MQGQLRPIKETANELKEDVVDNTKKTTTITTTAAAADK